MVVVLMGVSGSGKTTVGRILAERLGWTFLEGDDFHPPGNVEKMRAGVPLTDADRKPWLADLRERIDTAVARDESAVLACSALKHAYRDYLEKHEPDPNCVRYVYLHGSEELLRQRLAGRKGHYMNPQLLHSQFDALEAPTDAVRVDVTGTPEEIADRIRQGLGV